MRVITADTYDALSTVAAAQVLRAAKTNAHPVLALPTGRTPQGMYRRLADHYRRGDLDLSRATLFLVDEYVGCGREHPGGFAAFLQRHLLHHVPVGTVHAPDGLAPNPQAEADRYEAAVRACGGLHLAVLGIGENGHIGFNEPGTDPGMGTHVALLTAKTRWANRESFGTAEAVPERAITMGLATLLGAARVVVLAAGAGKREVLRRLVTGPVTPDLPASALRAHPDCLLIVDREAATPELLTGA